MQMESSYIEYSKKQLIYINQSLHFDPNDDHRWNFKSGATQCGKTTVDFQEIIPFRISVRRELPGLIGILGVSLGTIERNVLIPMRDYFASKGIGNQVSVIHKDAAGNTYVNILGQKVYLCGMLNKTAISRLRGVKFKYVYGDEVAEWNKEAFGLLKSRLSLAYSCFDGACNPDSDTHWLYEFINSDIDIYLQEYTIFDNPFLSKKYVDGLCREYAGTVYYDRYILGKWVRAEGAIYKKFANNPKEFYLSEIPKLVKINIGVDFGGNGSKHSFTATGFGAGYTVIIPLESKRIVPTSPDDLDRDFKAFVEMVVNKYKQYLIGPIVIRAFCDSAEQVLIRGLYTQVNRYALPVKITNATKMSIKDRIELVLRMMGLGIFKITPWCTYLIEALQSAVYNDMPGHLDERLDDGSTPIDSFEYSIESEYKSIVNVLEGRKAQ